MAGVRRNLIPYKIIFPVPNFLLKMKSCKIKSLQAGGIVLVDFWLLMPSTVAHIYFVLQFWRSASNICLMFMFLSFVFCILVRWRFTALLVSWHVLNDPVTGKHLMNKTQNWNYFQYTHLCCVSLHISSVSGSLSGSDQHPSLSCFTTYCSWLWRVWIPWGHWWISCHTGIVSIWKCSERCSIPCCIDNFIF